MGAKADAGPVGGLFGVREGIAAFDESHGELMGEVRMAAAVTAALHEAEVRLFAEVIDALRGEVANALGQQFGVVG